MTTEEFTEAARAEGRVLADEWMEKNGGPQTTGHHIAHTSIIYGFRSGAAWARDLESTDAEVEAAARELAERESPTYGAREWDETPASSPHKREWRLVARAALAAARTVRPKTR